MKLFYKNILFVILFVLISGNSISQKTSIKEFKELDSLAFSLYEKNSPKAEEVVYEVIEKSKNQKPNLYIVNAYTLLGIINKNRGYYITSLENNIHALNISEKALDTGRISACLNNIGIIYQLQSNYTQAIKYFTKSLKIEEKKGNSLQKSIRYYNLGECYKELKKYDIALSYFNNSLIIEEKYKNNEGIVYAYLGIAEVYLRLNNEYQAKMVLDKIDKLIDDNQVEENIVFNKLKGIYNFNIRNFSQALVYLDKAENLSLDHKISSHILDIYLSKIDVFESENNITNANKIYKKYIKLNDELTNSEIKNKIDDLTYQNELTKKELEIKLVLEERNLAKKNEKYEQKITWFVFLILVLSIFLILFGVKKLTNEKK